MSQDLSKPIENLSRTPAAEGQAPPQAPLPCKECGEIHCFFCGWNHGVCCENSCACAQRNRYRRRCELNGRELAPRPAEQPAPPLCEHQHLKWAEGEGLKQQCKDCGLVLGAEQPAAATACPICYSVYPCQHSNPTVAAPAHGGEPRRMMIAPLPESVPHEESPDCRGMCSPVAAPSAEARQIETYSLPQQVCAWLMREIPDSFKLAEILKLMNEYTEAEKSKAAQREGK